MTFAILFESVGFGEWFVLLAVVLIVVGPKRLPSTARKVGQYYSKFRRAADGFKRQLMEMDTEINTAVERAEKEVDNAVSEADFGTMYGEGEYAEGYGPSDEPYDGNETVTTTDSETTAAKSASATDAPPAATEPAPTESAKSESPPPSDVPPMMGD